MISGWAPTCDSAYSWRLYSAAPLGDQTISTMTWHLTVVTLSWHWANQSFPCPNNAQCLARGWQVCILKSWFDSIRVCEVRIPWSPKIGDGCSTYSAILSGLVVGRSLLFNMAFVTNVFEYFRHQPALWWQWEEIMLRAAAHYETWFVRENVRIFLPPTCPLIAAGRTNRTEITLFLRERSRIYFCHRPALWWQWEEIMCWVTNSSLCSIVSERKV